MNNDMKHLNEFQLKLRGIFNDMDYDKLEIAFIEAQHALHNKWLRGETK